MAMKLTKRVTNNRSQQQAPQRVAAESLGGTKSRSPLYGEKREPASVGGNLLFYPLNVRGMTWGAGVLSWLCQYAATLWWLFLTLIVRANQDGDVIISGIIIGTISGGCFYLGSRLRGKGDALERHLGFLETLCYVFTYRLGVIVALGMYMAPDTAAAATAAAFLWNQGYTADGQLMPVVVGLTGNAAVKAAVFWEILGALGILMAGLWWHLYGTTYDEEADRLGSTLHYKYIMQAIARAVFTTAGFKAGGFMYESVFVIAAWLPGWWDHGGDVTNTAFGAYVFVSYFFYSWIGMALAVIFIILALLIAAHTKDPVKSRQPARKGQDAPESSVGAIAGAGEVDVDELGVPKNQ